MSDLANGTLVQHASLGVGRVVAVERDAVHVFFRGAEQRFATKLRLPAAHAFLRTEGIEPDAWLQGLSAFTLDPDSRRWGLAPSWLTHDQALALFLAAHPGGFAPASADEAAGTRAARWRAGHRAFVKALGGGQAEKLLEAGDVDELARRLLALEKQVRPLLSESEATALSDALADAAAARLYFERLLELVSVPSPVRARFDRLFAAASALAPTPEAAWIAATLPPFLASPTRHVLVRPAVSPDAASRLGCDLSWDGGPNWASYSALRAFSTKLVAELSPAGATDLADVEWFLHVTASSRARAAKAKARPAAAAVAKVDAKVDAAARGKLDAKRPAPAARAASAEPKARAGDGAKTSARSETKHAGGLRAGAGRTARGTVRERRPRTSSRPRSRR